MKKNIKNQHLHPSQTFAAQRDTDLKLGIYFAFRAEKCSQFDYRSEDIKKEMHCQILFKLAVKAISNDLGGFSPSNTRSAASSSKEQLSKAAMITVTLRVLKGFIIIFTPRMPTKKVSQTRPKMTEALTLIKLLDHDEPTYPEKVDSEEQ